MGSIRILQKQRQSRPPNDLDLRIHPNLTSSPTSFVHPPERWRRQPITSPIAMISLLQCPPELQTGTDSNDIGNGRKIYAPPNINNYHMPLKNVHVNCNWPLEVRLLNRPSKIAAVDLPGWHFFRTRRGRVFSGSMHSTLPKPTCAWRRWCNLRQCQSERKSSLWGKTWERIE